MSIRSYGNGRDCRLTVWVPARTLRALRRVAKEKNLTLGELCWRFLDFVLAQTGELT